MNDLFFNQTLLALIIQLFLYYSILGLRMIIHPGTFFAGIWLFSVFSQKILMSFDLALVRDFKAISELNTFVFFTSIFFSFWALVISESSKTRMEINLNINFYFFKRLVTFTLIGSILLMMFHWYSLGITSLNLAHIRDLNTRDKTNYFGTEANPIVSLLKYTQFFYPLICIISGYFLGIAYLQKKALPVNRKYLYFGLLISLIYVLSNGGRIPLFTGIKYYFTGLCFAYPVFFLKSERKWLVKRILLVIIGLSFFSTFVNDSRREYSGEEVYSSHFESPLLSAISGGIEYAGAHYYGYQLRNIDTYDEENLGLGYFTFHSLFDLSLPFSSYHGMKSTLGNVLGFQENPIDYFYLWENNREGYFTTNSVFLGLKLDYGFFGTLIFLFIFTFYTHRLFEKIKVGKRVTIFTVFWFSLCFNFWAESNFKSPYASGLVGGIIMTILFAKIFQNKITSHRI